MGGSESKQQKQQSHIQSKDGIIDRIAECLKSVNLCLRPQYQSGELTHYLKNYNQISIYTDPFYGECYALESKQSSDYFILIKETVDKKQYQFTRAKIEELVNVGKGPANKNIIKTELITDIAKTGFYYTKNQFYIVHDYILIDLQKQFDHRVQTLHYFSEEEIKTIMKETSKGFQRLEQTEYSSVRMDHIYFCNDGSEIKVAHPKLFNYVSNLYIICQDYNTKNIYLAPQEMESLERVDKYVNHGWSANVFSYGMIILSLMTMRHLNEVYDYRACQINFHLIDQILKSCSGKFSYQLIHLVEELLNKKPSQRLSFKNLTSKVDIGGKFNLPVPLTLVKQKQEEQQTKGGMYRPVSHFEEPQHTNYIAGLLRPKVGITGQFYHITPKNSNFGHNPTSEYSPSNVVANERLRYSKGPGDIVGQYLGDTKKVSKRQEDNEMVREGQGLYEYKDGQTYIGEWHLGKMQGFGKLYYEGKKIRYEGQFKNGLFEGNGTEYSQVQIKEREQEIDHEYIKIFKGNWIKYEGYYKNDIKNGAGKIYFRKGYWKGNFKNGQANGQGIFYYYDSQKQPVKGLWVDGQLKRSQ